MQTICVVTRLPEGFFFFLAKLEPKEAVAASPSLVINGANGDKSYCLQWTRDQASDQQDEETSVVPVNVGIFF